MERMYRNPKKLLEIIGYYSDDIQMIDFVELMKKADAANQKQIYEKRKIDGK